MALSHVPGGKVTRVPVVVYPQAQVCDLMKKCGFDVKKRYSLCSTCPCTRRSEDQVPLVVNPQAQVHDLLANFGCYVKQGSSLCRTRPRIDSSGTTRRLSTGSGL